jgi:hypothetical protein
MQQVPLTYVFIALGVIFYLIYSDIKEGAKKRFRLDEVESVKLRMHWFYGLLGMFLLATTIYIFTFLFINDYSAKGEYWFELLLFNLIIGVFLLVLGLYFVLLYINHRVIIFHDNIEIKSWRNGNHQIKRSQINGFKEDFGRRKFQIFTKTENIKVHQHLVGLQTLKIWLKNPIIEE